MHIWGGQTTHPCSLQGQHPSHPYPLNRWHQNGELSGSQEPNWGIPLDFSLLHCPPRLPPSAFRDRRELTWKGHPRPSGPPSQSTDSETESRERKSLTQSSQLPEGEQSSMISHPTNLRKACRALSHLPEAWSTHHSEAGVTSRLCSRGAVWETVSEGAARQTRPTASCSGGNPGWLIRFSASVAKASYLPACF